MEMIMIHTATIMEFFNHLRERELENEMKTEDG